MRRGVMWLGIFALVALVGFFVLTDPRVVSPERREALPTGANPMRGVALFHAGGCGSCHAAPGSEDKTRLGGGLALASPFGTFYVPNISPHLRDGIGNWTLAEFTRAMTTGVSPAGAHYYPSFPYTSYWMMSAQDLADLFAHLKTMPAVEGRVRDHDLPFPFNIRRLLGGWKLLFFAGSPLNEGPGSFRPDPARSAAWNRGRYLVEGPSHCAECHSPRNLLGAIIADRRMAGGPDPGGKGFVPNITPHATGIADWTQADMLELLTTGFTPTFDSVGSNMRPVVDNTSKLPASDREAMAEYMLSLRPVEGRKKGGG